MRTFRIFYIIALSSFLIGSCGDDEDTYTGPKKPGEMGALLFYYSTAAYGSENLKLSIDTRVPVDAVESTGMTLHIGIEHVDGDRFPLPEFSSENNSVFEIVHIGCGSIRCDHEECHASRVDCIEERRFYAKIVLHEEGKARFLVHDQVGTIIDAVTLNIGPRVIN